MSEEGNEPSRPKRRRTWSQRLLITGAVLAAVACFVAATGIWFAQQQLEERNLVAIDDGSGAASSAGDANFETSGAGPDDDQNPVGTEPAPVETFPAAEPGARNFLITGADNNSCIDPDSPYAPAFGERGDAFGERSDTIMMWRVNPSTSQVAVLSFPRDLWVTIDGRSRKDRINAAYRRDEPQRLINTIFNNFGIRTDHYVQIDFCAFKILVDAVDGVAIPFELPVRDTKTGLNVAEAGCFTFDGDHALAYVRSRRLQVFDENGEWVEDPSSDLGRISRQQDFIRRVADELLANAFSPEVIRGLLDTSDDYVVTDSALTPEKILEFAGVIQGVDPAGITTYQVEARATTIQGNSVLEPRLGGDNMQAVLAVFRGEATLADRPDQVFEDDTTSSPGTTMPLNESPTIAADDSTPDTEPAPSTTEAQAFEALPEVEAEEIVVGFVPDSNISCT
jgi:LCP family protein required for cell wall assembly